MSTILTNPSKTMQPTGARSRILQRAPHLLMRALTFLSLGSIISVLIAWSLGLWADVESATVISATVPQRGRMWEISIWNTAGAMRIHSLRQVHSWSGWQVTGAPNSPMNGDSSLAWCPATVNSAGEWLVLDYPQRVSPKEIHVYENYFPGAVARVTVFNESGEEIEAWRGADPTSSTYAGGISKIPLSVSVTTQRVKLYIDSPKARGWNEIDAVGLLDQNNNMQWASDVRESSSYANLNATAPPLTIDDLVPAWCPLAHSDVKPPSNSPAPNANDDRAFEARGWPMLAMWSERPNSFSAAPASTIGPSISIKLLPRVAPGALPPVLPTHPIWDGLLFNSVFYGLLLAGAYWMLVKPRRLLLELLRMRRGCCIACGYELDFDFRSGCPECGWRRSHA